MERNMAEGHMSMQMAMHMKAILLMEKEKEREYIHGVIRVSTKVIGKEIKCMERVFSFILMVKPLKAYSKMIKLLKRL